MPHVDISMFSGRDEETKKKVAEAVVEAMTESLGCRRDHLSVAVHDIEPAEWNEKICDKVDRSKVYAGKVFENK